MDSPVDGRITTVVEAKELGDDAPVVLRGRIEKTLGDEHYLFRDETGEIKAEIEYEDFRGVSVSPSDTIEISGEVDAEWYRDNKVDVKRVVKIEEEKP
jgi:uncharacterized protein (TIGR00156 family)